MANHLWNGHVQLCFVCMHWCFYLYTEEYQLATLIATVRCFSLVSNNYFPIDSFTITRTNNWNVPATMISIAYDHNWIGDVNIVNQPVAIPCTVCLLFCLEPTAGPHMGISVWRIFFVRLRHTGTLRTAQRCWFRSMWQIKHDQTIWWFLKSRESPRMVGLLL